MEAVTHLRCTRRYLTAALTVAIADLSSSKFGSCSNEQDAASRIVLVGSALDKEVQAS